MEEIYKPLWVSIIGNVLLAFIKLIAGFLYSSIALISDGVHSLSDVVTSVIGYLGIKISSKPPDRSHPFGHSRFEPLVAFLIGEALIIVAYEIGRDAVGRMLRGEVIEVNSVMLAVTILSILVKEAMFRYSVHVGRKLNSQIIIADAYHHRSDALSSVAVLFGLGTQKLGFQYGDTLAGFIVALFLVKVSFDIILENVGYLTGQAPPFEVCEEIKRRALSVPNVLGVHDLRAHYVGSKLHVELHIEVPPELTLKEAHDISEEVRERIEEIEDVDRAFVHVDIKGVTE
ncbi:cation transporter [Thermococcus sp. GR7]|uniref:cation diffusion facilitator family transporter n=1 Tax=unclassified Thermococcus TaxID=2627626 RepID=UPI001431A8F8|nr:MULTISPECIES: cation diffusion facilitator family transporter [unclassified Thermococcus]NJE46071.1 cation transporter [Thermococcus sp. GR7]NJE78293.1 cation transporter [Thermococcus sp. GR4]NJF22268.1 cation transporter [Thermococcus sp. GR5]